MCLKRAVDLSYKLFKSNKELYPYPLYILHGFQSGMVKWYSIAKRLSNYGIQVVAVEARNHGESPYTDDHIYKDMVDDIEKLRIKLGHDKISLLGHSMGGITGMLYALQYGRFIVNLIVVDISLFVEIDDGGYLETLSRIKIPQDNSMTLSEMKSHIINNTESLISTDSLNSFLDSKLIFKDGKYKFTYNEMLNHHKHDVGEIPDSQWEDLVLFIGGEDSSYMPIKELERQKSYFPNQQVVYLPNCGHSVYRENPDKFISLVTEFLFP